MAHGSRLMGHASRLVAQCQEKLALGPGAWGTQRQILAFKITRRNIKFAFLVEQIPWDLEEYGPRINVVS